MLNSRATSLVSAFAGLRALEPFGAGNPRPVFMTRGWRVMSEPQVIKEQHLKMRVCGEDNRPFEAMWWRASKKSKQHRR
jgi:single-stranded-DNA-specific exonuclease